MTPKEIDCTYADEHDLAARYLAGQLSEADAEAFESHYFGCERCWGEVHQGGEIRFALGEPALVPAAGRSPAHRFAARDVGPLLAAAAAVAMVALGIRDVARRPEPAPELVYRGTAFEALRIRASHERGGMRLSWTPFEDARSYVLEVIASDGSPVLKREIEEPTVFLEERAIPPHPGVSFLVRVTALDPMHQVVATGVLTPLRVQ
jgi:Putative zinc-finger